MRASLVTLRDFKQATESDFGRVRNRQKATEVRHLVSPSARSLVLWGLVSGRDGAHGDVRRRGRDAANAPRQENAELYRMFRKNLNRRRGLPAAAIWACVGRAPRDATRRCCTRRESQPQEGPSCSRSMGVCGLHGVAALEGGGDERGWGGSVQAGEVVRLKEQVGALTAQLAVSEKNAMQARASVQASEQREARYGVQKLRCKSCES